MTNSNPPEQQDFDPSKYENMVNNQVNARDTNRSQKTTNSYKSGRNIFLKWCEINSVDPLNFTLVEIEYFVTEYLVNQMRNETTMYSIDWINNCINSVRERYFDNLRRDPTNCFLKKDDVRVRTESIKIALGTYRTKLHKFRTENFQIHDDLLLDEGYTEEEHENIIKYCWKMKKPIVGLKYLFDHVVANANLNRGDSRRNYILGHLCVYDMKIDGESTKAIIIAIPKSPYNTTFNVPTTNNITNSNQQSIGVAVHSRSTSNSSGELKEQQNNHFNKNIVDLNVFLHHYYHGTETCTAYVELELRGTSWRSSKNKSEAARNRRSWCDRMKVIKEINRLMGVWNCSRESVVERVLAYRSMVAAKRQSLSWFIEYIKQTDKQKIDRLYQ